MIRQLITVFVFCACFTGGYAQIVSKDLTAGNYKISLEWNDSVFYSGNIVVQEEGNSSNSFSATGFHSGYNWDSLADLNNDGINEYIIELETGETRSDYNMYLIFDFTKSIQPLYQVHNAEIITGVDKTPVIVSNMRVGPPAMEAKYSYVLKYDKGKLHTLTNPDESKVLKELVPFEEDYSDLISSYAGKADPCGENSDVKNYYAAYIVQQKIVNNEDAGWKFFEKNYNCSNKNDMKAEIKKIADENYSKITNPGSFNFNQ